MMQKRSIAAFCVTIGEMHVDMHTRIATFDEEGGGGLGMKKVKFIVGIEGLGFLGEVFDIEGLEPSNPHSEDLSERYEADMYSWGDPKIFWDVEEVKEDEPIRITKN